MTLREALGRLAAWRRRGTLEEELRADLDEHLALLARDFEATGLSPSDARAAARRQLGNLTSLREESRSYWGFPAVESVLRDLRYALRGLVRSPGFSLSVLLTLGLGIGANAALFGVLDRLMFRPFPLLHEPASVKRIYVQTTFNGRRNTNPVFPYRRYLDLVRDARSFSQVAAVSEWRLAVGVGDAVRVRKVAGVSASLFAFFDAPPALGRYFVADEDRVPRGDDVAVISHALWQSDPSPPSPPTSASGRAPITRGTTSGIGPRCSCASPPA